MSHIFAMSVIICPSMWQTPSQGQYNLDYENKPAEEHPLNPTESMCISCGVHINISPSYASISEGTSTAPLPATEVCWRRPLVTQKHACFDPKHRGLSCVPDLDNIHGQQYATLWYHIICWTQIKRAWKQTACGNHICESNWPTPTERFLWKFFECYYVSYEKR